MIEGRKLVFNCTGNGTRQQDIIPQFNNQSVDPALITATEITNGATYMFGPVTKVYDGGRLRCDFFLLPQGSRYTAEILLHVTSKFFYIEVYLRIVVHVIVYSMLTKLVNWFEYILKVMFGALEW